MFRKLPEETFTPSKKQKMDIKYTILFHGNCIDGWFSAYIANRALMCDVKMFPISPSQTDTWREAIKQMPGTHVLLLDVSVEKSHRDAWIQAGALSVNCIDHHATSITHWPADKCPIHIESCAALQTWRHFYTESDVPFWLLSIDRIDRWDNPTDEDRYIREYVNILAHKPVEGKTDEAMILTDEFLAAVQTPVGFQHIITVGKKLLEKKDGEIMKILDSGSIHTFSEEYIHGWNLPTTWLGANVFIIDNTGITLDSTEASYLVFNNMPTVSIFINYRSRYDKVCRKWVYIYSARSRGFDITNGTILKGHPTSAGATLSKGDIPVLPFLLTAP